MRMYYVRYHLSEYKCGRAVSRLEAEKKKCHSSFPSNEWVKNITSWRQAASKEGGNSPKKHTDGRGRNNTLQDDAYVSLITKKANASASGAGTKSVRVLKGTRKTEVDQAFRSVDAKGAKERERVRAYNSCSRTPWLRTYNKWTNQRLSWKGPL
ncbi:hypothetical protein NPIL_130261, partial [Nephila pilipes]